MNMIPNLRRSLMNGTSLRTVSVILLVLCTSLTAGAMDYVRLKNGQTVQCAVLRQDTLAVYTTSWDSRSLLMPPLQVYARDEVQSIWFETPGGSTAYQPYRPRPSGYELGGGFQYQTWASTTEKRSHMLFFVMHGGFDITKELGVELDANFTVPFQSEKYNKTVAFQAVMNIAVHPWIWKGLVPFAVAGGGASKGVPVSDVILPLTEDLYNVLDFGLGVKWGGNNVGYRVEWRHHYYTWQPDLEYEGVRVPSQDADASTVRATIFIYR